MPASLTNFFTRSPRLPWKNEHVHVLVDPHQDFRLETILHSWKSFSAKCIGRRRQHRGAIWRDEYFDGAVWSDSEYEQKRDYILANAFRR